MNRRRLLLFVGGSIALAFVCCVGALLLPDQDGDQPAQEAPTIDGSDLDQTTEADEAVTLPTPTFSLPAYTLFKDDSYESAGTFKIIWEILVSPEITQDHLNALLNELYQDALAKSPSNDDRPIVIDIKAYTSEEHATSGMAQWIGWISKSGIDTEPSIHFNEGQLNAEKGELKFGLSEAERFELWQAIVKVEDRASEEALQQYPDMQPLDEFEQLMDELVLRYKSELAQENGLSLEQLDEIAHEGLIENWPFPP